MAWLKSLMLGLACMPVAAAAGEYFGVIEPWQIIRVGSPVVGIVEEMPVDRGDTISAGTLLTKLNSDIEKVDYSLAKARYELAKSRYERQLHLQKNALAAEEQIEIARNEMELSGLQVERINLMLNQKRIVSPISGVVTQRLVRSGEYVYDQVPVVEIAQVNPLSVELLIPFAEYGKIKEGMKPRVFIEEPIGGDYEAQVEVVERVMDAASSTFGVRLKLENPGGKIPSGVKCRVVFPGERLSAGTQDTSH